MMLSAVKLKQTYLACLIAAILTEKDIYLATANKTNDINDRLLILLQPQPDLSKHFLKDINIQQVKIIKKSADEFFRRLKYSIDKNIHNDVDYNFSGVLIALAYPDRVAQQRNINESRYLLSSGKGAVIPSHLQQHLYEYIAIANLDARYSEATIYLSSQITRQQLEEYLPDTISDDEIIEWDNVNKRVETKLVSSIGKIILKQSRNHSTNKSTIHKLLITGIRESGLSCLNWTDKAINLKNRLQFIKSYIIKNTLKIQINTHDLPDFSDTALLDSLTEWLQPHLTNESSIKQCQKLDLFKLIKNQLTWQQQQLIDELAPEKITVPSGSDIRIDYTDSFQPVLAVRLQELFGLYDTPVILKGQCKLMIHLLSPAHKPMQITQDLNSFWKTTYHEVKKELKGKYKKHYWPDDPFTATATSKTKKNM